MKAPRRLAWLTALSLAPAVLAVPRSELVEAVAQQRAAVAERPSVGTWNDLGNLLVRLGSWEDAREAYHQALALDESSTLALYNLALLEMELGETATAQARFERLLELDPAHALAHYRLGDLYRGRDRNHRAVLYYADAFRLAPELTQPAIHPEILSNPLVTWALTRVYLNPRPGQGARRYGDPGRIARLFVGEVALPPVAPPAGDEQAEPPPEPSDDDGSR